MKIINNILAKENPSGTGLVIANNVLSIWDAPSEPGWTGKINGVTNPAKINGIPVANIAKVNGIASS